MIQRRIAKGHEEAASQIYAQRIQALDERIRRTKERLDALKIRPSMDGTWIAPYAERYKGMYLQRGKPLGTVADLSEVRIRATANQRIAVTSLALLWSGVFRGRYSSSLNEIAPRKPARTLRPTRLPLPITTASGIMAAAIIVNIAPAASPSSSCIHA